MHGHINTLPTNDEANALHANEPIPSRYPLQSGFSAPSDSANQPLPSRHAQNHNYNENNNLPKAEHEVAPPPYTPEQPFNDLSPYLHGGYLDDATYKEMIVIMGMRGGGKSSFVNQMVGGDVAKIGDGYTPCTFTCQAVPTRFGRSKVILIDTPGLDKSNLSETVVSAEISRVLAQMYQRGVSLRGFIYLHRITEKKTIGGAASVLKMFRSLCGDTMLLKNTILVTTGWQLPQVDESQGAVQERELRKFWSQMLHQGSTMGRYYGERDSGVGIVGRILGNEDVPFETEAELIARGKKLEKRAKIAMEVARLQQEMVE